MFEANDTATVEQETTTEETGTEETQETQSTDNSKLEQSIESLTEKLNAIEGRLNRQTKKEGKKDSETPKKTTKESSQLEEQLKSLQLQVAGLTDDDEVSLAERLFEETQMPYEKLLNSKYFKAELEELRTEKKNAAATSEVKGDKGSKAGAKGTAEYWIAKGEVPSADQADRKLRASVIRGLAAQNKAGGKQFYND